MVIRNLCYSWYLELIYSGLDSLKEVHIGRHLSKTKSLLRKLEQLRKESNRHFEIFVLELHSAFYEQSFSSKPVPFSKIPPLMEWLEANTAFLFRNLSMMAERVLGDFAVNYSDLEPLSAMEREIFLRRIEQIRSVAVSKPAENERLLLGFLEKWRPDHVGLKCFDHHSEAFLNELSLNFKFLRALSIEISSSFRNFKRFAFLFKLENLTIFRVNLFSVRSAVTVLQNVPSLKDFRLETSSITLHICNDSRMNVLRFFRGNSSVPSKHYSFPNKTKSINFLSEFEKIKFKELFERLPEPVGKFLGYRRFRDF